jgi:hypothetical protein
MTCWQMPEIEAAPWGSFSTHFVVSEEISCQIKVALFGQE